MGRFWRSIRHLKENKKLFENFWKNSKFCQFLPSFGPQTWTYDFLRSILGEFQKPKAFWRKKVGKKWRSEKTRQNICKEVTAADFAFATSCSSNLASKWAQIVILVILWEIRPNSFEIRGHFLTKNVKSHIIRLELQKRVFGLWKWSGHKKTGLFLNFTNFQILVDFANYRPTFWHLFSKEFDRIFQKSPKSRF